MKVACHVRYALACLSQTEGASRMQSTYPSSPRQAYRTWQNLPDCSVRQAQGFSLGGFTTTAGMF